MIPSGPKKLELTMTEALNSMEEVKEYVTRLVTMLPGFEITSIDISVTIRSKELA